MDIDTNVFDDGVIESTISSEFNGMRQEYVRDIIRTQDEQIQKALVRMGWTPPGQDQKELLRKAFMAGSRMGRGHSTLGFRAWYEENFSGS